MGLWWVLLLYEVQCNVAMEEQVSDVLSEIEHVRGSEALVGHVRSKTLKA